MDYTGPVNPDLSLGEVCSFPELPQVAGNPACFTDRGGTVHVFIQGTTHNLLEFIPDGRP
jgi:hypothetical protein